MKADQGTDSFLDQIINRTLEALTENEHFDEKILRQLRALAASGDLSRPQLVARALLADGDDQGS